MIVKTRLSQADFINVNFALMLKRPLLWIIFIFLLMNLLIVVASAIFSTTVLGEFSWSRLVTPVLVLVLVPGLAYFTLRRLYSSNKRLAETMEYKFEKERMVIQGESFRTEFSWDKIYKVTQTKKWLLVWQSKQAANILHKSDVWEGEMAELKQLLTEHHVKNNLP